MRRCTQSSAVALWLCACGELARLHLLPLDKWHSRRDLVPQPLLERPTRAFDVPEL